MSGHTYIRSGTLRGELDMKTGSKLDIESGAELEADSGATLDMNVNLDADVALTAAGEGANVMVTINHATAAVQGLDAAVTQLTTSRSSGAVAAVKASTTSLAGDSGGVYAAFQSDLTDGGGSATHVMLYSTAAEDAFLRVSASGKGGVTVGADGMTADPESAQEAGYVTIDVAGTDYQIPIYAA